MVYVKEEYRGTWKARNKKKGGHWIIGAKAGGVHREVSTGRGVAMFAIKGKIEDGWDVHHNDQDRTNDWPSNLAICTKEQHRILDALSLLRNSGFDIPDRPSGEFHSILIGVVWIGNLLEDYDGVIEEAITWFKIWAYNTYEWELAPLLEGGVDRRI